MDNDLQAAIDEIDRCPESIQKIALIEQAIRLADSLGEEEEAFWLRDRLITICNEYGQFMKAIVAFSWMLAKVDSKPDEYAFDYNMIWNYGALLYRAAAFDQVSLERLHNMFDDFARRMREIGASERNLHEARICVGLTLRDKEMTLSARDGIKNNRKDEYTDCPSCAQNVLVQAELCFGSFDEAMRLAQPLIDGKLSCNMVPLRTFGFMINHVYRTGQEELAWQLYKRGIKLIGNKGGFLDYIGNYLIYLSNVKPAEGMRIYERSLTWALNETEMPWCIYHFHIGAYILFKKLGTKRKKGKLMLDPRHPLYTPAQEGEKRPSYEYSALIAYHSKEAAKLAMRFDKRNGNSIASEIFAREKALAEL